MIQTQELDKLEDVGNAEAAYIIPAGLGDIVCVSGALNQFYKQYKKKLYIITDRPTLFVGQEYCKDIIDMYCLSGSGRYDLSFIFQKFKKIHTLYWQTDSHLKGKNTIVENYCDQLKVERVKYPYFKINEKNLPLRNKPYILISLKDNRQTPFIKERDKYFSDKMNDEILNQLKKDFQNYDIFDIGKIEIESFYELLLIVANCVTFLSVDTALQHMAANEFCQKKGVVLWNSKRSIKSFGYDININLCYEFMHPYAEYDTIMQSIKKLL